MPQPDLGRQPVVPPDLLSATVTPAGTPASGPNRIRLFRIQPGFLSDPPGLDNDDKTSTEAPAMPDPDGDADWITIAVGNDNPFFDFRRPSDPGGVGYTRVNTQVQLFDTSKTACSVGFQAVTPAGLASDGLADKLGTTVLSPAFSLFHTLDDSTAVQAYVGKNLPLMNTHTQTINPDLQCGLAVQRPVSTDNNNPLRFMYFSVGALTQVRLSDASTARTPVGLDVLPGLHYKMADNWWISGAVVLPTSTQTNPTASQQWQVTCSFQF
jgi:hypothetical protein